MQQEKNRMGGGGGCTVPFTSRLYQLLTSTDEHMAKNKKQEGNRNLSTAIYYKARIAKSQQGYPWRWKSVVAQYL